jgi:hypothetical protein
MGCLAVAVLAAAATLAGGQSPGGGTIPFAIPVGATLDPPVALPAAPAPVYLPQPANGAPDREGKNGKNGDDKNGEDKNGKDDKDEKKDRKPPRTLFEWAVGPAEENGNGNGNGNGAEEEEEDTIVTDRPDFTEASRGVGLGRIQLEMGYTYTQDRDGPVRFKHHSAPEMLVRMGLFAEWLEFRIGQNFASQRGNAGTDAIDGGEDLYLGVRFDLTEQKGFLPESSIIFQMTVPTGSGDHTTGEVMPGFNYLFGWDVIPDCISLGGSFGINRQQDEAGAFYTEVSQSMTVGYSLTKRLGAYTEWFALYPSGAVDPGTGPEHYMDGGFTYQVTNNFQLDIRAGVGLNRHADNFFSGAGFAVRY